MRTYNVGVDRQDDYQENQRLSLKQCGEISEGRPKGILP